MTMLSQKLANIILSIDKYNSYLNFQDQIIDLKLIIKNFYYVSKTLYIF